jgi:hypothetical protein
MAQAESITTAIRELMSREEPPQSTNPTAEHAPHPIHSDRRAEELERRAEHLQRVLAALHVYVTTVIADTAQNIPDSTLDRSYLDHVFHRFAAERLAEIRDSATELRVRENWSGS